MRTEAVVLEPVRVSDPLLGRIRRAAHGVAHVDAERLHARVRSSLPPSASDRDAIDLAIQVAASLVAEEPEYEDLTARLLARQIDERLAEQGIESFADSVRRGAEVGLIGDRLLARVDAEGDALDAILDRAHDDRFRYFGLQTLHDRYLLRHPTTRVVIEGPQHFFLRVAAALTTDLEQTRDLYEAFATLSYLPSSPTLFNAGTRHEQLSSCFLLDSPDDSLESIYERYREVAMLSKFSGGIGIAYHRVRSRGSLIQSTNGRSNGIVPWLKTLDSSVAAVNQGGKRRGACCVYLEPWHADIEEFLELRGNTGDEARRAHNLNLANWIPDLFMRRVEADASWSLFDPKTVPQLPDLYGEAFERAYVEAEDAGLAVRTVPARALYRQMMRSLAETGNGWMTFKDRSNALCNQTARPGRVVHLSNLCTEIVEVTGPGETAVCNLGSINLVAHVTDAGFDFDKLRRTVRTAVRQLDRVIDLNLYPVAEAGSSNARWRPVGLGVMGLQDVFFAMRLAFDAPEALELSTKIQEEISLTALETSAELAEAHGPHPAFAETRAAQGILQPDLWGVEPTDPARYAALKIRIREHGLRNSLLLAIAPTATIASIAGCYECIEPQVSNLFKRETLSGEFLRVNRYLVEDLRALGLWTDETRARLRDADGSVQAIGELPAGVRRLYRTAWELSQKTLIDLAAARGPFIDQSQSLNLFMESPTLEALSSMYMYAWKRGLKTTYYLRSRPATRIAKTSRSAGACSLENPETCEACQ
ncbi:MAG: ribonucleoside-diphosphate reductase subunit alpha [Sandaracinaceae bacterium]